MSADPKDHVAALRSVLAKHPLELRPNEITDAMAAKIADDCDRYRLALETIANANTYARHGAAHAQVSRCVRIAIAALNGEDPDQ